MPQMNPIWWVTLSLIFLIALILTNSINYFYKNINVSQQLPNIANKKFINWKW
uniref:ATP synthase complex subunit 8 n=2 Tax=Malostenopsocus TaxID=1407787 RepID=A0AAU7V9D2_9NEOP